MPTESHVRLAHLYILFYFHIYNFHILLSELVKCSEIPPLYINHYIIVDIEDCGTLLKVFVISLVAFNSFLTFASLFFTILVVAPEILTAAITSPKWFLIGAA